MLYVQEQRQGQGFLWLLAGNVQLHYSSRFHKMKSRSVPCVNREGQGSTSRRATFHFFPVFPMVLVISDTTQHATQEFTWTLHVLEQLLLTSLHSVHKYHSNFKLHWPHRDLRNFSKYTRGKTFRAMTSPFNLINLFTN